MIQHVVICLAHDTGLQKRFYRLSGILVIFENIFVTGKTTGHRYVCLQEKNFKYSTLTVHSGNCTENWIFTNRTVKLSTVLSVEDVSKFEELNNGFCRGRGGLSITIHGFTVRWCKNGAE